MTNARFWVAAASAALLAVTIAFAGDDKPEKKLAAEPAEKPAAVKVGQEVPDFTLLDCTGTKHKLSDYKDKVLVLDWVNQECPWSRKSVPVVKALQQKFADKGVVWLGVESTFSRKPEENETYIKDAGLPFTILMDNDGKVGKALGAKTTPHIFVINKGKLAYAGALHDDQFGKKPESEVRTYVDDALNAVLAGKDVPLAETTPWGCGVKYKDADKAKHTGHGPEKPVEKP